MTEMSSLLADLMEQGSGATNAVLDYVLHRLQGCLRRLDVPDASEYDEADYAEAADAVFKAAQAIADMSRFA